MQSRFYTKLYSPYKWLLAMRTSKIDGFHEFKVHRTFCFVVHVKVITS